MAFNIKLNLASIYHFLDGCLNEDYGSDFYEIIEQVSACKVEGNFFNIENFIKDFFNNQSFTNSPECK